MNEEELKAIWQKNENLSLENFDFAQIKQKAMQGQQTLRRKIKREIISAILLYVLIIPFFYLVPSLLLLTPILIAIWVWYLKELGILYKLESDFRDFENLKEFLNRKSQYLRGYFRRSRYFAYFGATPFYFLVILVVLPLENIIKSLSVVVTTLIICQIIAVIIVEFTIWLTYRTPLAETEDLLRQLDETQ